MQQKIVAKGIRLTPTADKLSKLLAARYGTKSGATFEVAIRALAKAEGITEDMDEAQVGIGSLLVTRIGGAATGGNRAAQ